MSLAARRLLPGLYGGLLCSLLCGLVCGCGESPAKSQRPTASSGKKSRSVSQPPAADTSTAADAAESTSPAPRDTSPVHADLTPQPVYRPSDTRPRHDAEKLESLGIHRHESRRLILYTDIDDEQARPIPGLVDQAYDAMVKYFGPLPPDREQSEFQITGYIMADKQPFVETGLLPEDLPGFAHGRHSGAEFWMNDQKADYYRRHLALHEATHCFMTIVPNPMGAQIWYMEGMAELFGTHTMDAEGRGTFRVFPASKQPFAGLGRIRMVNDAVQKDQLLVLEDVLDLRSVNFVRDVTYAWSWALCVFLDQHPRYRDRFRTVTRTVSRQRADGDFIRLFENDWSDLQDEWLLYVKNLCHGYDIEQAAIDFHQGEPISKPDGTATASIAADRGWQSARVQVQQGERYQIVATGQFSLAQKPKPWISEPQGVSIRYCDGQPLGQLRGMVREPPSKDRWPPRGRTVLDDFVVGRERTFTAPVTGTLYLRVNEFWNELRDNAGQVAVTVRKVER